MGGYTVHKDGAMTAVKSDGAMVAVGVDLEKSKDALMPMTTDQDILHFLFLVAENRPKEYPFARVAAGFVSAKGNLSGEIGVGSMIPALMSTRK